MAPARRPAGFLPAVALGAGSCLLLSRFAGRGGSTFVATPLATPARGRVAMRGFKEDFAAWRQSLSEEERNLLMDQARGEYSKKFRKTDRFSEDIPEEKKNGFADILAKFFESELEDYKKETAVTKVPDYDGLLKKAGDVEFNWGLRNEIVTVDRMAERRYNFATFKELEYKQAGRTYPQNSPRLETWYWDNTNETMNWEVKKVIEEMRYVSEQEETDDEVKELLKETLNDTGVNVPDPEEMHLLPLPIPAQLLYQTKHIMKMGYQDWQKHVPDLPEDQLEAYGEELARDMSQVIGAAVETYAMARDEIQGLAAQQRDWFRSQAERKDKKLTKADILKEIWRELPKHGEDVPALDEDFLAEMAKEPAVQEGEFMHSWGTADVLYKSEAYDSFGDKYLLGVFETEQEAKDAFTAWNAEYEKERSKMKDELQQWSKQEQARLERERGPGVENVEKLLKEARAR